MLLRGRQIEQMVFGDVKHRERVAGRKIDVPVTPLSATLYFLNSPTHPLSLSVLSVHGSCVNGMYLGELPGAGQKFNLFKSLKLKPSNV